MPDLVDRSFHASAPNRLLVADIADLSSWKGRHYVAAAKGARAITILNAMVEGYREGD